MSDDDEDKVGYKRPPKKHQFEKGQSGNRKGRPRKPLPTFADNSIAAILERAGNETILVNGSEMSLLEVEIQSIQRRAAKGDVVASKHLTKLRADAGVGVKVARSLGGVLVVPGTFPLDEWSLAAARQQAQFREAPHNTGGDPDDED